MELRAAPGARSLSTNRWIVMTFDDPIIDAGAVSQGEGGTIAVERAPGGMGARSSSPSRETSALAYPDGWTVGESNGAGLSEAVRAAVDREAPEPATETTTATANAR